MQIVTNQSVYYTMNGKCCVPAGNRGREMIVDPLVQQNVKTRENNKERNGFIYSRSHFFLFVNFVAAPETERDIFN